MSKARALDVGDDGNAGSLELGLDAALSGDSGHLFGTIDYMHRITDTPLGELSAFAHGFGGVTMDRGIRRPEMGVTAGLGLRW